MDQCGLFFFLFVFDLSVDQQVGDIVRSSVIWPVLARAVLFSEKMNLESPGHISQSGDREHRKELVALGSHLRTPEPNSPFHLF
jgi:hypothetical protein